MEWPAELDALVAAPGQHTLLFEDDDVRVLETRVRPGETTPVHTHRWAGVLYVLAAGRFVRRDGGGTVLVEASTPGAGQAAAAPALPPHTFENVGPDEIRIVSVELKRR